MRGRRHRVDRWRASATPQISKTKSLVRIGRMNRICSILRF